MNPRSPDAGSAIVIVMGTLLLLSAMGLALVLLSITETMAAGNVRRASAALYAAEAGVERVLPDLLQVLDWDAVLDGRTTSGFVDGPPSGQRTLSDGRTVSLDEIVNLANCGGTGGCTVAAMDAATVDRPWGANNPRWRLFAYGPLAALAPGAELPPLEYVVVLVADDPAENDNDPLHDGRTEANPGTGLLLLRAEAFGPDAAHSAVEATVARGVPGTASAGYAAQQGQGRSSGSGPPNTVQVPGATLIRSELSSTGGMTRQ